MEELAQTPQFGPSRKINLSEPLISKYNHKSNINENKNENRKRKSKEKQKQNKTKPNKYISGNLPLATPVLDKEDPYYELLTKKIKLRNDFDRKHVQKLLAEAEEAFEGCDLDDKINDSEP